MHFYSQEALRVWCDLEIALHVQLKAVPCATPLATATEETHEGYSTSEWVQYAKKKSQIASAMCRLNGELKAKLAQISSCISVAAKTTEDNPITHSDPLLNAQSIGDKKVSGDVPPGISRSAVATRECDQLTGDWRTLPKSAFQSIYDRFSQRPVIQHCADAEDFSTEQIKYVITMAADSFASGHSFDRHLLDEPVNEIHRIYDLHPERRYPKGHMQRVLELTAKRCGEAIIPHLNGPGDVKAGPCEGHDPRAVSHGQWVESEPKRPRSAYFLYVMRRRPELHGEAKHVAHQLNCEWKQMASEERHKYEAMSTALQCEYDRQCAEFNQFGRYRPAALDLSQEAKEEHQVAKCSASSE